jgi:chromate transporter
LFFGYHLLWPEGFAGAFDARSALIAVGAAVALFKYKRSVMEVICLCALVGLTVKLLPL